MVGNTPEDVSDTIRYQRKAVDDPDWIPEFLAEQETGVLGLVDGDTPHLVTQLFVYDADAGALFFHGARGGRSYDLVDHEPQRASFTTSEQGQYIPAEQPIEFTVEYSSVVAYGSIDLVTSPEKKRRVLEQFMEKFAPHLTAGEDYEQMTAESVDKTAIYRLDVESWSGKAGWADAETPDAYDLTTVRD